MRSRTAARNRSRTVTEDDPRVPRALLTATVLSHIAQFHQPAINLLKEAGYEVHVAARNNLDQKPGLTLTGVDRVIEVPFERSPLTPRNFSAARRLRQVLRDTDYDLIHCNTPVAGLLTRLLGQRHRRQGARLIYMAHGFHFFKGAPIRNWILFYPLEWLAALGTDILIVINLEDYRAAKRLPARSIGYVPGVGVDLAKFNADDRNAGTLRNEIGLPANATLLLSVGELNENKNHRIIVKSVASLSPEIHYAICGEGPLHEELQQLSHSLGVADRVHFLGYRRDIPDILSAADIYCHPSHREGLPVALMEAMGAGLPVVASGIRGVEDLVDDGEGGRLVDSKSLDEWVAAFRDMIHDKSACQRMGLWNTQKIRGFSRERVDRELGGVFGLGTNAAPESGRKVEWGFQKAPDGLDSPPSSLEFSCGETTGELGDNGYSS